MAIRIYAYGYAQSDTAKELSEVIVTGFHNSNVKATSLNLEPYSLKVLEHQSPYNLSDALAKLPGISQMTTGTAITKPVIRGLYGNRILVLLSGLRFDNQQFQDEHGLGLSQIGIDRVEVIKGPASLLYGTDAIGGVINVIESTPAKEGNNIDINTRLYSNTLGTLTDVGYSSLHDSKWWRLRAGLESNADYTDGNNDRVLNSRNKGYYIKAGFGFNKDKWIMNNAYNFSFNQYGFILDSNKAAYKNDARFSRDMSAPHHNVMINALSSQNTFLLKGSTLKINAGIQSNHRAEDEGGGEISLNMHLLSALENARWEKNIAKNWLFVINQQFTYEKNTNYGKRILIPDANMLEGNLSAFTRLSLNKINIEAGIGYNNKDIITYKTRSLNSGDPATPDTTIKPFNKDRSAANAMLGFSYNPNEWLNIKANISTGNRAANLAELSSNGLHEGTFRVEVGDPNMKMEQNINTDVTIEADTKNFFLSASGFYNRFLNYIYLTLTNEPSWFGFDRYRYVQNDAYLYGGELIAMIKAIRHIEVKEVFSATKGMLDNGDNLPFIPAYRSVASIKYATNISKKFRSFYVEPEFEYVFAQNNPAQFETSTPDYGLVHLHTGVTTLLGNHTFEWNLSGRNLLNKTYVDHLSRLKYYGFYNQGINFILSVSTNLGV